MSTSKKNKTQSWANFDIFKVASCYAEDALRCPATRQKVVGYLRSRQLPKLMTFLKSPEHIYGEDWLALRQISAFFSKNVAFSDEKVCSAAALSNFDKAELLCKITNRRLDYIARHPERCVFWEEIKKMQRLIADLLGSLEAFRSSGLGRGMRFTDGATEDRTRSRALPFLKITGRIKVPQSAMQYLTPLLSSFGVDTTTLKYEFSQRNRVEFVPKNWSTHRSIACEPTHLLPLQLSTNSYFVARLRRWGVDLTDQSLNQEKARLGSIDGSLATIDLRMASDTMAINAVALLLPDDWFVFLNDLRSKGYTIPSFGREGWYNKFSSMGNGFTFSLETMIFTAACKAVGSTNYQVYGDDIVIESEYADAVIALLRLLGFRTNVEKTFSNPDYRFRESCGCDWYDGKFVTPFYVREIPPPESRAALSHNINGLVACAIPNGKLYHYLAELVKKNRLLLVPYNTDTYSGVFIPVSDAYAKKKITSRDGVLEFFGYAPRCVKRRINRGWRPYFLWSLKAFTGSCERFVVPYKRRIPWLTWFGCDKHLLESLWDMDEVSTSSLEIQLEVRYSHAKRAFVPVRNATPSSLYWFSIYLECGPEMSA